MGGDAEEIINEGECITPPPTTAPEPTKAPKLFRIDNTKTPPPEFECVDDVIVKKKMGSTEFPLIPTKPVVIVGRDGEETVTVDLGQSWTDQESSVGYIFAS